MHISKLLASFLITIFILFCLYITSLFSTLSVTIQESRFPPTKIYTLQPVAPSLLTDIIKLKKEEVVASVEYPTVQTAPSSPGYMFVLIKEFIHLKNHTFDNLFFANKRVAEMQTWGKGMTMNKELIQQDSIQDINDLIIKTSLNKTIIQDILFYKKNNTWEYALLKYREHILAYLDANHKREDYLFIILRLNNTLAINEKNIQNSIIKFASTKKEQQYLLHINNLISAEIRGKIDTEVRTQIGIELPENSLGSQNIIYPLTKIINDKEYGTFHGYLNDDYNTYLSEKNYYGELQNNPNKIPINNTDLFQLTIKPSEHNNLLILKTDVNNAIDDLQSLSEDQLTWQKTIPIEQSDSLLFELTSSKIFEKLALVELKIIPKNKKDKPIVILHSYLKLDSKTFQYKKIIETNPEIHDQIYISLKTAEPIALDEMDLLLTPIRLDNIRVFKTSHLENYKPSVVVTKKPSLLFNSYILEIKNTSTLEDRSIMSQIGPMWRITDTNLSKNHYVLYATYIPSILLCLLIICVLILLAMYYMIKRWRKSLSLQARYLFKKIIPYIKILIRFLQKHNWAFKLSVTAIILYDIFIYTSYSDLITTVAIAGLIFVYFLNKLQPKTYIVMGLFLFVITTLLYAVGQANISYKAAMWSFIFFFSSVFIIVVIRMKELFNTLLKKRR